MSEKERGIHPYYSDEVREGKMRMELIRRTEQHLKLKRNAEDMERYINSLEHTLGEFVKNRHWFNSEFKDEFDCWYKEAKEIVEDGRQWNDDERWI